MYKSFLVFFVYYRRVWQDAIPTQPPHNRDREARRRKDSREEGGVGMAGCHTLLNKKRQNSNKFWRLTVCRKRA